MENEIQQLVFTLYSYKDKNGNEVYTANKPKGKELHDISNLRKVVDKGIWVANIPESERTFFNGAEKISFTFDRELAEKHRDIELICDGSFLLRKIVERVAQVPKVSKIYSINTPEMPPNTIGIVTDKSYYRSKVAFNYKVSFEGERKDEKLYSVIGDTYGAGDGTATNEELFEPDMSEYTEKPDPKIKVEEEGHDILKMYIESCQKLEKYIEPKIAELRQESEKDFEKEMKVFDAYLDEQKNELQKKKENVSFHLYFFQKEEEIDKLINNLEEERKRKFAELKDKYQIKINIDLIDAVVIGIPTIGVSSSKTRKTLK